MPYNPGIQDRSGEILAGGISQFGGSLAQVIAALGQQRDQAEELRTQMGGPKGKAYGDEGSSGMDLSMFGVPEGPNEGTGEGAATAEDKAKSAAKVAKALRDLGEHGYGYDRNMLETMGLPELRGLARRSEMQAIQQERQTQNAVKLATLKHLMAQTAAIEGQGAEDDSVGLALRKFSEDPNADFDTRMNQALGQLKGGRGAVKLVDVLSRMGQRESKSPATIDQVDLPFGHKGVVVRGSKDLKVLTDFTGQPQEIQPGLFQDARGNLRVVKPTDETGPQHRSMQTLVDAEKALQGIEEEISAYNNRAERAKADKSVKAYPESRLQDLMKRKARIERVLEEPTAAAAAAEPPKRNVERVTTLPNPSAEASPEALTIKAEFQAGKITKAEAVKRLQALGMK